MALVTWSARHEIGVATIDDQHRDLFDALNRLHEAVRTGRSHAAIAAGIQTLVDHARIHFRDEELHMAAIGFPGRFEHADEHAALLKQVLAYQDQHLLNPDLAPAEALTVFLVDWAMHHILGLDKQYAEAVARAQRGHTRHLPQRA